MNIDKFKQQHQHILDSIDALRRLSRDGVDRNAEAIAQQIVAMSATIKLHLAAEDHALYPSLQRQDDPELARMGQAYQQEMGSIAGAYDGFSRRWNHPAHLRDDADGFRRDANEVLRRVHERMQRENRQFYPRVEAL
jgi:hypothetical protein